ncbi:MAG: hypothetical protein RLZZ25_1344, partial [Gemmatimonadota bacterium]
MRYVLAMRLRLTSPSPALMSIRRSLSTLLVLLGAISAPA